MDLAGMMGLKRVLREEDLTLVPSRPRLARVVEPPGATPTARRRTARSPRSPDSTLPRAVIFRDSFASRLVPFLSEHFSRAVYMWQNDFDADAVTRESRTSSFRKSSGGTSTTSSHRLNSCRGRRLLRQRISRRHEDTEGHEDSFNGIFFCYFVSS